EPAGIFLELDGTKLDYAERILEILDHGFGEFDSAFTHQSLILAIDQDELCLGIGSAKEIFDLCCLELHDKSVLKPAAQADGYLIGQLTGEVAGGVGFSP